MNDSNLSIAFVMGFFLAVVCGSIIVDLRLRKLINRINRMLDDFGNYSLSQLSEDVQELNDLRN